MLLIDKAVTVHLMEGGGQVSREATILMVEGALAYFQYFVSCLSCITFDLSLIWPNCQKVINDGQFV